MHPLLLPVLRIVSLMSGQTVKTAKTRYKLYLAGPGVFRTDAYEFGRHLEAVCADYGFEGIYPIGDASELIMDKSDPRGNARNIFLNDMRKLFKADGVIADMTPFRGPGMDGGTAFEMGAAYMAGKPIVGYGLSLTARDKTEAWIKSIDPLWEPTSDAVTGLIYDHNGLALEDFGGVENLMLDQSIEAYTSTFEEALVEMREVFDYREGLALIANGNDYLNVAYRNKPPGGASVGLHKAYQATTTAGAHAAAALELVYDEVSRFRDEQKTKSSDVSSSNPGHT